MKLGPIFKIHREEYGISIRQLAVISNLAASKLSAFENNKAHLKTEEIVNLYRLIGLEYHDFSNHEKAIYFFLRLFKSISYKRSEDDFVFQNIVDLKEINQFSDAYITILAGVLVYYSYHPKSNFEYARYIRVLLENINDMDSEIKPIFYDTLGVYYIHNYQWDKALEYIDCGIKHTSSSNILGMLYYHKTMILKDVCRLTEALSCVKKAKKYFDKDLNQKKSISCSILLACIYTRLGRFQEAEFVNMQCIEAREHSLSGNIMIIYNNLIWNYVLSEQYEKALKYSNKALNINKISAGSIYFYQSFAYWKLGELSNARASIIDAINYLASESDYMKSIISSFRAYLSLDIQTQKKEQFLLLTLKDAKKIFDIQLQIFILKLLIELDYKEENYSKQIQYRDQIINLLESVH